MTAPHQTAAQAYGNNPGLAELVGLGAFQIGDAPENWGQNVTKELVQQLITAPASPITGALTDVTSFVSAMRSYLHTLPLEVLQQVQAYIPGALLTDFGNVEDAVTKIMDALNLGKISVDLGEFKDWLTATYAILETEFHQIVDVFLGLVVTPITTRVSDFIAFWVDGFSTLIPTVEAGIKDLVNKIRGTSDVFATVSDAVDSVEISSLDADEVIAEILANLKATQWFTDLRHFFGDPSGWGTGSVTIPALDDITILGPLKDAVAGKVASVEADVTDRLQHIAKDGDVLAVGVWKDASKVATTIGGDLTNVEDATAGIVDGVNTAVGQAAGNTVATVGVIVADLHGLLGHPSGLGTGSPIAPALDAIPLLGTPSHLSDSGVVGEILTDLKATQWFIDLKNFFGNPTNWGTGTTPTLPSLDDIPILVPLKDKVAGKVGAVEADVANRLQNIEHDTGKWLDAAKINTSITLNGFATDIETAAQGLVDGVNTAVGNAAGLGVETIQGIFSSFPGPNVLHNFGLGGDDAHGLLWDAICNGLGLPGSGHSHLDVQNAVTALSTQVGKLVNGKKYVLTIVAAAGSGNYDPSVVAPFLANGDKIYPVALGSGSGGAGGSVLLHGNGGNAGSWSSTSVTPLIRGTDFTSSDTFDWVVGPGGTGGAVSGGSSNPGNSGTITLHGGSVVATGTGGASVTGTSATSHAWDGAAVSPNTNTVGGTPLTGGVTQTAAGRGGHSSGGGGAGGNIGYSLSAGGTGASGLVAFLAVQA